MLSNNYAKCLHSFIDSLVGYASWKSPDSVVLYGNKTSCDLLGFKSRNQYFGSSDYDIPFGDLASHAEIFRAQDQRALATGAIDTLEILRYTDGIHVILSKKSVLKDPDNKIVGVLAHCISMNGCLLQQLSNLMLQKDAQYQSLKPSLCHYSLEENKFAQADKLPRRTDECLFYILRGKTAKEIANFMSLSVRTVEKYFDALKFHFNCQNKSQLIEKTIKQGYLNFIPKHLLDKQIINIL